MSAPAPLTGPHVNVRRVTHGPGHWFFGYYDKCPWNRAGRHLLAMHCEFAGRQPEPGERLTLGLIDLHAPDHFTPFDTTTAWSWQQGTMLQWLGPESDREVVYNVVEGDRYAARVRDVHTGKTRTLPRPVYDVSGDARQAVSLDFARLHRLRPGYGYATLGELEHQREHPAPEDNGLWHMDMHTGASRLIVSLGQLAGHPTLEATARSEHWVNHAAFNPAGDRLIFLHRWNDPDHPRLSRCTRLFSVRPDGSELTCLSADQPLPLVSHFDWRDDHTLLAWSSDEADHQHYHYFDVRRGRTGALAPGILDQDGHCTFSPEGRWLLTDTYPDDERMRALILHRLADDQRFDVARFYAPLRYDKPHRCDLHPRWSRDGRSVCIDSAHELDRHLYLVDVSAIVAG